MKKNEPQKTTQKKLNKQLNKIPSVNFTRIIKNNNFKNTMTYTVHYE